MMKLNATVSSHTTGNWGFRLFDSNVPTRLINGTIRHTVNVWMHRITKICRSVWGFAT